MPESLTVRDFSAGWSPQVDPVNGPKNALLKMDSIELDQTGALKISPGTSNVFSFNYPANAHTLYSKFTQYGNTFYAALEDGTVYRNNNSIIAGGSTTRAAFVAAFNYIFVFSGTKRRKDDGLVTSTIGLIAPSAPVTTVGVAGILNGVYEYVQVNVFNHGNGYVAKSPIGAIAASVNPINATVDITPNALPAGDANEAWIFRRGVNLEQFYLVSIRNVTTGFALFNDAAPDSDLLELNITTNPFLNSTNSSGLPDDILEAVGQLAQRTVLFTGSMIHFTEPNSIDNYDTRYSIKYGGNQSTGTEIFLWAKKLGENLIIIGTTMDVYILTGSFTAFPDGFIDVYLRPLGTKVPPLYRDADVYQNNVVYCSNIGWILLSADGSYTPLCPPATDRLYRGETLNGYEGVPIYIFPQMDSSGVVARYSCGATRNKLFCRVPQIVNNDVHNALTYRMEIYDFVRKYWRPLRIAPRLIYACEDGSVIGFFNDTQRNLRYIDDPSTTLNNGAKQTVKILTTFQDNNTPFNRKEFFTLKLRIYTGGDAVDITAFANNDLSFPIPLGSVASNILKEISFNIQESIGPVKNIALELSGQVSNFILTDINATYELYPEGINFYRGLLPPRQGEFNKAKLLTWPIVINTMGAPAIFTPSVDGVNGTHLYIVTNRKQTIFYHASEELVGVDFDFTLASVDPLNLFELWKVGPPELVNMLPMSKRYDQVGPEELFRYGKLRRFQVRLKSEGSSIPYSLLFEDASQVSGSIVTVPNVEDVYEVSVPKTTAGQVVKIILGPTDFLFYRYYFRLQVATEGKDTENTYVVLPAS